MADQPETQTAAYIAANWATWMCARCAWTVPPAIRDEATCQARIRDHIRLHELLALPPDPAPAASPGVDPWAEVKPVLDRTSFGVMRHTHLGRDVYYVDDVDRAVAAERQQHTALTTHLQSIGAACGFPIVNDYQQLAETICKAIHRRDAEVASLTQQLTDAQTQIATLRAAMVETLKGMDRAGGDGYGMPECPWCHCQFNQDGDDWPHTGDCELIKMRESLAASLTGDQP